MNAVLRVDVEQDGKESSRGKSVSRVERHNTCFSKHLFASNDPKPAVQQNIEPVVNFSSTEPRANLQLTESVTAVTNVRSGFTSRTASAS